jgi:hypothetical protein
MRAPGGPFDSQVSIMSMARSSLANISVREETMEEGDDHPPEGQAPVVDWNTEKQIQDGEPEKERKIKRPTRLIAPIYNGLGVALALCEYCPRAITLVFLLIMRKSSLDPVCECYSWSTFSMVIISASRWPQVRRSYFAYHSSVL